MIISHKYRCIFFAVPKTASQSIRTALRPHLGEDDWEQADWRIARRLPIASLAEIEHGHVTAAQAQAQLAALHWRDYFKFAFVRNPWERFISCAFFRNARRPLFMSKPQGYLKLLLDSPRIRQDLFFRPQYTFLAGADGRLAMDFVGRFEHLQRDFDRVCRLIGAPAGPLAHLNLSQHGSAIDYYDADLLDKVGRFYEQDIRRFEYSFRSATHDRVPERGIQSAQDSPSP